MKKLTLLFIIVLIGVAKSQKSNVDYYPLKVGYEWKYKVVNVDFEEKYIVESFDNTYEAYQVKEISKIGDLNPIISRKLIEKRNGKVLLLGTQGNLFGSDWKTYVSYIILESNLKVGKSWKKDDDKEEIHEWKVVSFDEISVTAGTFKDVIAIDHIAFFIDSKTKKKKIFNTSREYYAPNIGLIRTDVKESKTNKFDLYSELIEYKTSDSTSKK